MARGSVRDTLRLVQTRYARVSAGQANFFYGFGQAQPPAPPDGAPRNTSFPSCICWKRTASPTATTCWWR